MIALGAYYTARSLWITQRTNISERFTRAVDQLAAESLAIRIGGIYALEQIAVESKSEHPQVTEVLGAFLRTHAGSDAGVENPQVPSTPASPMISHPPLPSADCQAAATVLARRDIRNDDPKRPVNLAGAHLEEIEMPGALLENALLNGLQCRNGDLSDSRLCGAHLRGALLSDVNLTDADLTRATLSDAELCRANLVGATARHANLAAIDLQEATLADADLRDSILASARLVRADLRGARLDRADLSDADLGGAVLDGCSFAGATYNVRTRWPADVHPDSLGAERV